MFRKIKQDILQQHGKELKFELYQSHKDALYLHLWNEVKTPHTCLKLQISNDKKIIQWVYPNNFTYGQVQRETQGFGIKASPLVILSHDESMDSTFLQAIYRNLNDDLQDDHNLKFVKEILEKHAN